MKDLVGKTQLFITDHVSPSKGMGGREVKSCFMLYIFLRVSEKADLQPIMIWRKVNPPKDKMKPTKKIANFAKTFTEI